MKTPCCGTAYCEDCIHSYLLENDFVCPKCSKKVTSLENLLVDKPTRTRVGDYIDKLMKENTEAEEAALKALEASEQVDLLQPHNFSLFLTLSIVFRKREMKAPKRMTTTLNTSTSNRETTTISLKSMEKYPGYKAKFPNCQTCYKTPHYHYTYAGRLWSNINNIRCSCNSYRHLQHWQI